MVKNEKKILDSYRGHALRKAIGVIVLTTLTIIQGASAATSTLSGDLYYPHDGASIPIRNSYFEVWKSGFLGVATFVTSGSTDGSGHFTATFDGDCNCWVTIFTRIPTVADVFCPVQSYFLCAPPPGQSPTFHYSFPSVHVNDGESVNYGTQVLPSTGLIGEAAYLADTILSAWLFVESQTGVHIPQVSVQFPCGALCPGEVYFNPYLITDMYMKPGLTNDLIWHEYGHAVMFAAYGGPGSVVATVWPVPFDEQTRCLVHSPLTACGVHVAWTEGWAEFFASAVLNNAGSSQGASESPPATWSSGDWGEGRVAAALWDLYAPSSPSTDHFGVGFAPIFNTLWHRNTHPTFKDFYNDFRNTHPQFTWAFNAAAFQNTINYNNPPRIISLAAPTGSATGIVSLSVTGADDAGGYVDGFISSATFEYSKDGGANWVSLGTVSTNLTSPPSSRSTTVPYLWVPNFTSSSVIVRARVSDNLGALSDWTQSAPFSVTKTIPMFGSSTEGLAVLIGIFIVTAMLVSRKNR